MGRRTLVVTHRPDGRYDVGRAHWGVDADPDAQTTPVGRGWSAEAVWNAVDATVAQVRVRDGGLRTYCVCWLDPECVDVDDVVLARTATPDALRTWWVRRKSAASAAVAGGADPERVRDRLRRALARRAPVTDDASFLGGDR